MMKCRRRRAPVLGAMALAIVFACTALPAAETAWPPVEVEVARPWIVVDTGVIWMKIDRRRTGFLSEVWFADTRILNAVDRPVLTLDLILCDGPVGPNANRVPGATGHGRDARATQLIAAIPDIDSCEVSEQTRDRVTVTTRGKFVAGDLGTCPFELQLSAFSGRVHVRCVMRIQCGLDRERALVRSCAIRLPGGLFAPKRCVVGGDRGVVWDTAARTEYLKGGKPTSTPDIGRWDHFGVIQETPNAYRIWKSESLATGSLALMRGVQAPGWMTVQDRVMALSASYRNMTAAAPKAITADMRERTTTCLWLHPPQARALDLREGGGASLFGRTHEMAFHFNKTGTPFEPRREIAALWGLKAFASQGGPKMLPLEEPGHPQPPPASGNAVFMVAGGVPFPRGALKKPEHVRLLLGDKDAPIQARTDALWPDGSIKWLHLVFPLDGKGGYRMDPGAGQGKRVTLNVTVRQGESRTFNLVYGEDVRAPSPGTALAVRSSGDRVAVNTGAMEFTVRKGGAFIETVKVGGRVMVEPGGSARRHRLDYLVNAAEDYETGTSNAPGTISRGDAVIDEIQVEESGPLRATLRLAGYHGNDVGSKFVMRVEAFAGRTYLRVWHTFVHTSLNQRRDFVQDLALALPMKVGARARLVAHGADLGTGAAGVLQESYLGFQAWHARDAKSRAHVAQTGVRSAGWIDLSGADRGAAVVIRNMWQEFPKEVAGDAGTGVLSARLWPASSNVLDIRRYSAYAHQAQGEAICRYPGDESHRYVRTIAAAQGAGFSKTHEMLWYFHVGDAEQAQVARVAADFQSPPLPFVSGEWNTASLVGGPVGQVDTSAYPVVEQCIRDVADFFLYHRRYWGWYGMIEYGEMPHGWGKGYGGYVAQHGWTFDNGRWGAATNTEGLPNLFMQLLYLRTGERRYYFAAEATARHNRDVDTHQWGPYKGTGARHGVGQWSDGYRGERVTVTSEFRFYGYLSGDRRCADVLKMLVEEKYLVPFSGRADGDWMIGGRPYGLLHAWEMTGDPRYGRTLRNLMHAFAHPEGVLRTPNVNFPSGLLARPADVVQALPARYKELNSASMFFHNFGTLQAIIEYQGMTGDKKLADSLMAMARKFLKERKSPLRILIYGARNAPSAEERKAFRDRLGRIIYKGERAAFMFSGGKMRFAPVPADRTKWVGPEAYMDNHTTSTLFFYYNDALFLPGVLPPEPTGKWSKR